METEVLSQAASLIIICCFASAVGCLAGNAIGHLVGFILDKIHDAKEKRKEKKPETE